MANETTIVRWNNEVRMPCSSSSNARAGEEQLPGGGEYHCTEPASFFESKDETAIAFFCHRHGKERARDLGQTNAIWL